MKKILVILLTLMCLMSLAGCSTNDATKVNEEPTKEEVKEEVKEESTSTYETVSDVEIPEFSVDICGITITQNKMKDYPVYKISVSLTNSEGTNKDYTYYGYSLTDVLKAAGLEVKEGEVVATATDGYEITYKDNIILDSTLIALIRDDKSFKEGPWLAPCASETNGDYLKNLSAIKIVVD